jgi:DNA-binding Lrp family transcriptional regulator
LGLDLIDKRIIVELVYNSRLSYQTLARHFELTSKAVRNRVNKLIEIGVIQKFVLALNRTACGGDAETKFVLGHFWTDGSEQGEVLIQQIGSYPSVYYVFKTTRNSYGFYALVIGFQGLSDLTEFVQGRDGVTKVETDSLIFVMSPGYFPELSKPHVPEVKTLTNDQWAVIRCLKDSPRMPIAEVARRTEQSMRRVRKTINLLVETRYVTFQTRWTTTTAGHTESYIRTDLDLNQISREEFANWLYDKYPLECWDAQSVADSPETVIQFISAETIHIIDEIQKTIKAAPFTKNIDALVIFKQRKFDGLMQFCLNEQLKNAGFD